MIQQTVYPLNLTGLALTLLLKIYLHLAIARGGQGGKGMIAVREQKATEKNAVSWWLGQH